jgi:beta-glucosidase
LLTKVLRGEWGFNGFVVSDYTSVMELINHGIALDPATATRKAITAGVDVDMMSHFYDTQLPELIRSGQVPMSVVDEAVRRVLRVKFATGLFERPYAEGTEVTAGASGCAPAAWCARRPKNHLCCCRTKTLRVVRHCSRFLLHRKKIAFIGPLADDPTEMVEPGVEPARITM